MKYQIKRNQVTEENYNAMWQAIDAGNVTWAKWSHQVPSADRRRLVNSYTMHHRQDAPVYHHFKKAWLQETGFESLPRVVKSHHTMTSVEFVSTVAIPGLASFEVPETVNPFSASKQG